MGKNPTEDPVVQSILIGAAISDLATVNNLLDNLLPYFQKKYYSEPIHHTLGEECVDMFRRLMCKETKYGSLKYLPVSPRRYCFKKIVLLKTINDLNWALHCERDWRENLWEGDYAYELMASWHAEVVKLKKRVEKLEKDLKDALEIGRYEAHQLN